MANIKNYEPSELTISSTQVMPETRATKDLIARDAISGLLVAYALVMPSKRLEDAKLETVAKKSKDKDFVRGSTVIEYSSASKLGFRKRSSLKMHCMN